MTLSREHRGVSFLRGIFTCFCISVLVVDTSASAQATGTPVAADAAAFGVTSQRVVTKPDRTVEFGTLRGVPYRVVLPTHWNGSLVVLFHGYAENPYTLGEGLAGDAQAAFDRGFATVMSAYSQTGWALQQAIPETDQLREYFIARWGKPKEIFVAGGSMGGALTMISMEQRPEVYAGALALCGRIGSSDHAMQERFAFRAAFDVYFPGVMPPLLSIPADYKDDKDSRAKVLAALQANPADAEKLRHLMHQHKQADVAQMISYITYVVADLQRRAGGNPFDNSDLIYNGTGLDDSASDADLNARVTRTTADPVARQYLVRNVSPTGRVLHPMLALETVYDPLIPSSTIEDYPRQVAAAGFSANFVQQYVVHDGHCTMNNAETVRAFDELLQWVHEGKRPKPGLLP